MAASFTFTQGGYNLDGTLSGSFIGEDLNQDLALGASELSEFSVTFFAGELIGTNSFSSSDIETFLFNILLNSRHIINTVL